MAIEATAIWMDGALVDFADAKVHVLTHTLHYGVGVFEGIRAYRRADGTSHVFRLREHIDRLYDSAHLVQMKIPYPRESIHEACIETLKRNHLAAGYLRPLAYYGSELMGLGARNPVHVAVAAWAWGAYLGEDGLKNGIRCKISSYNRLDVNVNMAKGKICGQYVNSVIAKREALDAGFDEAIMLDAAGNVTECTGENLFMVKRGRLITAPLGSAILGGITRDTVLTIARDHDVAIEERLFTRDELYLADEVFLCGTAAEITPVREIDHRAIGTGRPGSVTSMISKTFFDVVSGSTAAHDVWRTPYLL